MAQYKAPNRDVFGHCVKCGKSMVDHHIIDGVQTVRLTGEYREVSYLLNDGSQMRVAMCEKCMLNLTNDEKETNEIMKKVYRGWQHEVETYAGWKEKSEEKKRDYLERYSKKRIVVRADELPGDVVKKTFDKYKKAVKKEPKHILKEK